MKDGTEVASKAPRRVNNLQAEILKLQAEKPDATANTSTAIEGCRCKAAQARAKSKQPATACERTNSRTPSKATCKRRKTPSPRRKLVAATTTLAASGDPTPGAARCASRPPGMEVKDFSNAQGIINEYRALLEHCNTGDRVNIPIEAMQHQMQTNRPHLVKLITLAYKHESLEQTSRLRWITGADFATGLMRQTITLKLTNPRNKDLW